MNEQRGLALVLVLWMLTLLSIMAGSFALSMRRETAIITGLKTNAQARSIAEAGVALAELMMLHNDPELRWQVDGRIYEMSYAEARVRLRLLSEAGKIDINAADETQLQNVMRNTEMNELRQRQLIDAILDWRDSDDIARYNGAEQEEYLAAGLKYAPANRPFQTIAELQMVLGMDETLFNWMEPLITVYTNQPIDLQKASREVLLALNPDDPAFSPVDSSADGSHIQHEPVETAVLQQQAFPSSLAANEAVTIIAEAMIADGSKARLKTVVKQSSGSANGQPFQILDWQSNVTSGGSLFAADMDELLDTRYAESRRDH